MSWLPRPRRDDSPIGQPPIIEPPRKSVLPILSNLILFAAAGRGVYRIFNAAGYRFYWSDSAPPVAGSSPQATNSTLAYTTSATFGNGTWYFSVSYFDGVLDSGFLPLGPHGETYITLEISGGAALPTRPTGPNSAALKVLAGGVIQIVAYYLRLPDGVNAANTWSIAYTTDGTTPASNSPSITKAMSSGPLAILTYSLPAQPGGTVVKVQLQTRLGASNYSMPGTVLSATAVTAGPSSPLDLRTWPGLLPGGDQ